MKCPHCLDSYHPQVQTLSLGNDKKYDWFVIFQNCPNCNKKIVELKTEGATKGLNKRFFAYPRAISRTPISPDVPDKYASDYKEACFVLADSPKASAALSRRCLQNILRDKAGVKKSSLNKEIEEVLGSKQLPTYLAEAIDAIRVIGNFAAHPIKSESSGEIVDVEPGEAEWLLDTLESLLDFYFIEPAKLSKKRDSLNKKLEQAGKPLLK